MQHCLDLTLLIQCHFLVCLNAEQEDGVKFNAVPEGVEFIKYELEPIDLLSLFVSNNLIQKPLISLKKQHEFYVFFAFLKGDIFIVASPRVKIKAWELPSIEDLHDYSSSGLLVLYEFQEHSLLLLEPIEEGLEEYEYREAEVPDEDAYDFERIFFEV